MSFILGVNVDHIATLRNARDEGYPDLIELTKLVIEAGANQITAHLREDRRHIRDKDIFAIKENINIPLNMEMANTEEMLNIALKLRPQCVCLVPEKREEITTEGGLDIGNNIDSLKRTIEQLKVKDIKVSLFIDADINQLDNILLLNPNAIEINTGKYSNLKDLKQKNEVENIKQFAKEINKHKIKVHSGHGLNLANIKEIAQIREIVEFNIGHFLISYALKVGLCNAIKEMKDKIKVIKDAN